jgi:hypothetical protein
MFEALLVRKAITYSSFSKEGEHEISVGNAFEIKLL